MFEVFRRKRSGIVFGILLSLFIVRELPAADLLRQRDNSVVMTDTSSPNAFLRADMVGIRTGIASMVRYYVRSNAGSVNWFCQDHDVNGTPNYAYFGAQISDSNPRAPQMELRTIPNATQTIHNFHSLEILGHTYVCFSYNIQADGNPDLVNDISSLGDGTNIFFPVADTRKILRAASG
jgi:hypothetical protein